MADSADVQRTLATARAALAAPAGARARVLQGLAASGALQTPAAPDAAKLTAAAMRARGGTLVMISAAFIGGYWLGGQRAPERTSMDEVVQNDSSAARASDAVPEHAASLPEEAAPNAPAGPAPTGSQPSLHDVSRPPATRTRATPRSPRAPSHTAPTTFADEIALLSRADRALRAGEGELALSFLNELERRYPDSKLTEERGAARIMAECALAAPGAVARAERFLRDRRASVYSDRVLRSCGIEVAPSDRADGSQRGGH
jgi:hypothetical protein